MVKWNHFYKNGIFLFLAFLIFTEANSESKKLLTENLSKDLVCIKDTIDMESSNSFLLIDHSENNFLIDAGWSDQVEIPKDIIQDIKKSKKVATHFHFDHIRQWRSMENIYLTEEQVQVCKENFCLPSRWQTIFNVDPFQITGKFSELATVNRANRLIQISCEGHSSTDTCFLDKKNRTLFAGDLFYIGHVFYFLPGGSPQKAIETLENLLKRNDWDKLALAHGECLTSRASLMQYKEDLRKVIDRQLPWSLNFDLWLPLRLYKVRSGYILTHLLF